MSDGAIAEARFADVDQIVALERASFPTPWRREFFESELTVDGRHNRVLRIGRTVVAYCFSMYYLDEMHVNKIAVADAHRRRGLARRLMEDALEFARATGIRSITLEVRESNQAAQDFYRSLQFETRYHRPRYYPDGEAAVVMGKEIVGG